MLVIIKKLNHLNVLQFLVANRKQRKSFAPNIEDITKEFFDDLDDVEEVNEIGEIDMSTWTQPSHLQNQNDLPPSMWPIEPNRCRDCTFQEWGAR